MTDKTPEQMGHAWGRFLLGCIVIIIQMVGASGGLTAAQAGPRKTAPIVINLKEPIKLWRGWPQIEFDKSGKLIAATWKTWATNADFVQTLHYMIFDQKGVLQCSSESNHNQNVVFNFPRLAMLAFHPRLVSVENDPYTNRFLDDDTWDASPDLKSFVRVRRGENYSANVELWKLTTPPKKQWQWTLSGKSMPPLCHPHFDSLQMKSVVAIDCGSETVFLDAATGIQLDKLFYAKDGEIYIAGVTCIVPGRNYFVCARYDSTRLRVLSLQPPHPILQELGSERISFFGCWDTHVIQCSSDGRFVLKTSQCGNLLLSTSKAETVIYDTATWKVVWRANQDDILMSPDGKQLVVERDDSLEIRNGPSR